MRAIHAMQGLIAAIVLTLLAQPALAQMPNMQERTPVSAAQWTSDAQKFHFAVLGDRTGGGENEWPLFDRAMNEMNLLQPDFVIMVGDAIQGYSQDANEIASEWQEFRTHADRLRVPLFFLPGNHDISSPEMLQWWRENMGRTYYSFNYKSCHFLVLNTQEYWFQNDSSIGSEQVKFAVDDLNSNKTARHTFVFMHVPVWTDANNADWNQIENALGNRPYTVFAGHTHRLTFEKRLGKQYIVVGTTRGINLPREEDLIPQLGAFPHYTQVNVEGNEARVAVIEPGGPVWPADIAPREFQEAARNLVAITPVMLADSGNGQMKGGVSAAIKNGLPNPVEVSLEAAPAGADGWHPVEGGSAQTQTVQPGENKAVDLMLTVSPAKVLPVPRLKFAARYDGKRLYGFERNMPLFPDSALREMPEWEVVGPFDAGKVSGTLPEDPRTALPKIFTVRGPEKGFAEGATYAEGNKSLSWQPLKSAGGYVNLAPLSAETPVHVLAYASCGIYSPNKKIYYAEFRADDYAQIFVNGVGIENEKLFRTRSDATYVALPINQGWNTITVKCINITGGWTFRLLPADPGSQLQFAPHVQ